MPLAPSKFIAFAKDVEPFAEVPLALSGYPREEAGSPVFYLRKEVIPIGEDRTHPDKGYPIFVPRDRAEGWIQKFNLMLQRGHAVPAPPDHNDRKNSVGNWVALSLERNKRGGQSLFGVLKVVGERAKEEALNKDVSIRTLEMLKDDHKNEYPDAVEHIAVTPYSALTGLSGWASIAATRGPAEDAFPVLDLTALQEPDMDLKELRKALGAADTLPDADVISQAAVKLGTIPTLETAKATAEAATAVALTRATAAEQARDTANLALSRATPVKPTARELYQSGKLLAASRAQVMARGITKAALDSLEARILPAPVNYAALSLSRAPTDADAALIGGLDVLSAVYDALAAHPLKPANGEASGPQVLELSKKHLDGDDASKPDTREEARTEAEKWQAAQLKARGLSAA